MIYFLLKINFKNLYIEYIKLSNEIREKYNINNYLKDSFNKLTLLFIEKINEQKKKRIEERRSKNWEDYDYNDKKDLEFLGKWKKISTYFTFKILYEHLKKSGILKKKIDEEIIDINNFDINNIFLNSFKLDNIEESEKLNEEKEKKLKKELYELKKKLKEKSINNEKENEKINSEIRKEKKIISMKKYILKYLEEVLIEIKSKLSDENKIDIDKEIIDIKKILLNSFKLDNLKIISSKIDTVIHEESFDSEITPNNSILHLSNFLINDINKYNIIKFGNEEQGYEVPIFNYKDKKLVFKNNDNKLEFIKPEEVYVNNGVEGKKLYIINKNIDGTIEKDDDDFIKKYYLDVIKNHKACVNGLGINQISIKENEQYYIGIYYGDKETRRINWEGFFKNGCIFSEGSPFLNEFKEEINGDKIFLIPNKHDKTHQSDTKYQITIEKKDTENITEKLKKFYDGILSFEDIQNKDTLALLKLLKTKLGKKKFNEEIIEIKEILLNSFKLDNIEESEKLNIENEKKLKKKRKELELKLKDIATKRALAAEEAKVALTEEKEQINSDLKIISMNKYIKQFLNENVYEKIRKKLLREKSKDQKIIEIKNILLNSFELDNIEKSEKLNKMKEVFLELKSINNDEDEKEKELINSKISKWKEEKKIINIKKYIKKYLSEFNKINDCKEFEDLETIFTEIKIIVIQLKKNEFEDEEINVDEEKKFNIIKSIEYLIIINNLLAYNYVPTVFIDKIENDIGKIIMNLFLEYTYDPIVFIDKIENDVGEFIENKFKCVDYLNLIYFLRDKILDDNKCNIEFQDNFIKESIYVYESPEILTELNKLREFLKNNDKYITLLNTYLNNEDFIEIKDMTSYDLKEKIKDQTNGDYLYDIDKRIRLRRILDDLEKNYDIYRLIKTNYYLDLYNTIENFKLNLKTKTELEQELEEEEEFGEEY